MIKSLNIQDIENVSGGDCTCVLPGDIKDPGYTSYAWVDCLSVCCGSYRDKIGAVIGGKITYCGDYINKVGQWRPRELQKYRRPTAAADVATLRFVDDLLLD